MIQLISAQYLYFISENCFKIFAAIQNWMLPDLNKHLHISSASSSLLIIRLFCGFLRIYESELNSRLHT